MLEVNGNPSLKNAVIYMTILQCEVSSLEEIK
jgi:hypothetical protein